MRLLSSSRPDCSTCFCRTSRAGECPFPVCTGDDCTVLRHPFLPFVRPLFQGRRDMAARQAGVRGRLRQGRSLSHDADVGLHQEAAQSTGRDNLHAYGPRRRSIPLRNAQRDLLTRPDGRKRPVSAPGRFSRFRPIWGCGAHMDGRGEADADGAIGRIGPSHGAGARTGGRRRAPAPRHVRWVGPRRIASNGVEFRAFQGRF